MGRIPDEVIEQIRDRVDLVDLIGRFVSLKRSGRSYKGLCPFHNEKTPSFNVNPDRQAFYCFGCQEGGNAVTFLMKIENLTVERDSVAPRLAVDFPSGTVTSARVTVRGATEPGCRVVIGDREAAVGADGRFEHEQTLQPGYNFLVVQAIDSTGNTAFSNHTILADLGSPEAAP